MRVLVCGGRNFKDAWAAYKILDRLHHQFQFDVVIEGNASGADRFASLWATRKKTDNLKYPAQWERYGRLAGPIRNTEMLDKGRPDLVVAFPGGRGTANMVQQAKRAGVRVIEVERRGEGMYELIERDGDAPPQREQLDLLL